MSTKAKLLSPDEIKLKPFTTHGLEFTGMSGNDHQADCPFCGKYQAFHVDPDTTKWVCSSNLDKCGRRGNLQTFLRQWATYCHENTSEAQFNALSRVRDGFPAKVYQRPQWTIGYNPLTQEWLFPNHQPNGDIHDIRRWKPKRKPMGTPTMHAGLWNHGEIALHPDWPIWVCEGEGDGLALWHWVKLCMMKVVVVAVPGANIFKEEWLPSFTGREVVFWYDRDTTGDQYSWKKAKLLMAPPVGAKCQWHFWPENFPEKFDVRDNYCVQLVNKMLSPKAEMSKMMARIVDLHPAAAGDEEAPPESKPPRVRPSSNPSFAATMKVFADNFTMTRDLEDATRFSFATVLSQQIQMDPLWGYLIGPSGGGKTAILMSLQRVPEVFYQSTVTSKALLSGFKEDKKDGDPSVIKKLIEYGVGVFKDFTQLLGSANEMELQAVTRVLRGAYDGICDQHFGNGVVRRYVGKFTLLAGVTNEIHAHSDATVGERFVKFQLRSPSKQKQSELLMKILYGSNNKEDKETAMSDAALAFLDRDVPDLDIREVIPQDFGSRIVGLAELIECLRYRVTWERDFGYDKVLTYRPQSGLASRLSIQLGKLAMALSVVDGVRRIGHAQHRLVERVAFDTGTSFNLDIVEAMMAMNAGKKISRAELCDNAKIPRTTLNRRLEDLLMMELVRPSAIQPVNNVAGRQPEYFDLDEHVRDLWKKAAPGESHMEALIEGREAAKKKGKSNA